MTKHRILCVDDEENVLEGLKLHLGRKYEISTASSGAEALEVLSRGKPFAVVVSDMRMPSMSGSEFLTRVCEQHPDSTRVLLTGYSDLDSAISAVNDGQVFRFLTKPVSSGVMRTAIACAVEQHELVTSRRVLLEQTLHGSIQVLSDVLAMSNPVAFGRANRVKKVVSALLREVGAQEVWAVEVAAMLSQIASVSLPPDTAEKYYLGHLLTREEDAMVERLPEQASILIGKIPRLEGVSEIILKARKSFKKGREDRIPLAARALRVALDYVDLQAKGQGAQAAWEIMQAVEDAYDEQVIQALLSIVEDEGGDRRACIGLAELKPGMVFTEDVKLKTGVLFVPKGFEVTEALLARLRNVAAGVVQEPVKVVQRRDDPNRQMVSRD